MYAVFFEDEGAAADQRQAHMKAHLAFLDRHAASIKSAGPLLSTPSGLSAGGLWMVDCPTETDVWDLIREDPFWPTGLRKSVTVYRWNRVFANGEKVTPS